MDNDETTKIRLSLDVSPEVYETIEGLAKTSHTTKSAVLTKVFAVP